MELTYTNRERSNSCFILRVIYSTDICKEHLINFVITRSVAGGLAARCQPAMDYFSLKVSLVGHIANL